MATDAGTRPSTKIHRGETLRYIILPILGVLAIILLGTVATLLLRRPVQVALLADWLLTVLVLCPMALCLFPVCILMIAAVAGLGKAHGLAAKPLRRLEDLSADLANKALTATDSINRQTVNVSTRFAFFDRWMSLFDRPSPNGQHKESE